MPATPLIIGEAQKRDLEELRKRAAAAPIDMPPLIEALKTPEGKRRHMDRMNELTIDIPLAFKVTFSIEVNHPCGTCRHMSMSVDRRGRTPSPEAVWMVAKELGFTGDHDMEKGPVFGNSTYWLEDLLRGTEKHQAVNLVQPIAMSGEAHA